LPYTFHMARRVTTIDIAREAKVSQSTVSFVLSGKGGISSEVKEKVLAVAARLGYEYRKTAASMKAERKRTIGILIDLNPSLPFVWSFIRPILYHIEEYLLSAGCNTVLLPISVSREDDELMQKIEALGLDAVISMLYVSESLFEKISAKGKPILVVMNEELRDKYHAVLVDDFQLIFDATTYLVNLGHRRILYVDYERPDMPSLLIDRFFGFAKAAESYRLENPNAWHVRSPSTDIGALKDRLESFFAGHDRPTAIIALDDYLAASLVLALESIGLSIPGDISLISVGDVLDYDQPYIPRITTEKIDNELAGNLIGQLLIDVYDKGIKTPQIVKVTSRIADRGSCRDIRNS
jgi:LacI family transcriptional regulator